MHIGDKQMDVLKSAWSQIVADQMEENRDKALRRQKVPNPSRQVERLLVETNLRLLLNNLDLIDTKRLEAIEHVISVELRERNERA
jgi:hypothetical protein